MKYGLVLGTGSFRSSSYPLQELILVFVHYNTYFYITNSNNKNSISDMEYVIAIFIFLLSMFPIIKHLKKYPHWNIGHSLKKVIRFRSSQQNFKWSISKYQNKFRNGYGIQNLKSQDTKQFLLLSILPQKQFDIMKIINSWKLNNLSRLFLNGNNISSIQYLAMIQMPNLQCLALSNNNIISLKSMRKFLSSNIIWIQINNNPLIEDLSALNQLNLPYLQFLWLQFFNNDKKTNDNQRWLAKCQSNHLQRFHIRCESRIVQHSLYAVIKRKYLKIDIRAKF